MSLAPYAYQVSKESACQNDGSGAKIGMMEAIQEA
jgi:hypothetical protein